MTLTTGILMFGKMSVDIRVIVTTPTSTIRMAMTVKLYGRLRANRTIHILWIRMELGAWPQSVGSAHRADPENVRGSVASLIARTRLLYCAPFELASFLHQTAENRTRNT